MQNSSLNTASARSSAAAGIVPGAERDASLRRLALRYVWSESPDSVLRRPDGIHDLLCQILRLGTLSDYRLANRLFGADAFRDALLSAKPGQLDDRSWKFWHLVFGISPVPPAPKRQVI